MDTKPLAQSLWQRYVMTPIATQLRQGITPEKIALTIALGSVISVFPIIGATTLMCAMAGVVFRLNQPVIQVVNYLVYPLQFVLLIPFYRAGEFFGAPHLLLTIPQLLERFKTGFWQFIMDFGLIALGGVAAWCVLAPAVVALLYFLLRGPLRMLAARNRQPITTSV